MSFAATVEQMRHHTKTVTRRHPDKWRTLNIGDQVLAVEKAQGLQRGQRQVPIGVIEITSNTIEPLGALTLDEVAREGFPGLTPLQFINHVWAPMHGPTEGGQVRRIEFRHLTPLTRDPHTPATSVAGDDRLHLIPGVGTPLWAIVDDGTEIGTVHHDPKTNLWAVEMAVGNGESYHLCWTATPSAAADLVHQMRRTESDRDHRIERFGAVAIEVDELTDALAWVDQRETSAGDRGDGPRLTNQAEQETEPTTARRRTH